MSETFETIGFFSLVAIFWIVARDEVVEVGALECVFLEREMFVRAEIVNPEINAGASSHSRVFRRQPHDFL